MSGMGIRGGTDIGIGGHELGGATVNGDNTAEKDRVW